jgi:hypothetical protein
MAGRCRVKAKSRLAFAVSVKTAGGLVEIVKHRSVYVVIVNLDGE